jgi:protein-S-isoprenylcysteine O-methyltransferase Ste14
LKLKVPPPVVALVFAGLMWLIARFTPSFAFAFPRRIIGGALFVIGLSIALSGITSFRRARTTLNPMKPEAASSLVTSGIYRYTRNPMYLGLLFALLAVVVLLGNVLTLLLLPAFILYMNHFQIVPEEEALRARFGEEFSAYQSRVRRWG